MAYSGKVTHLDILHFNDVYDINARELKRDQTEEENKKQLRAGCSRFRTAWRQHGMNEKLCLFSGDLFSPSLRK